MGTRTMVVLLVVAGVGALFGIQAVLIEQWIELYQERERQTHLKQEILRLQRLVADVDNGFRGYVLMKHSAFLGPMVAAEGQIPRVVERLGELTETRPDLRGCVQIVQARVTELLETKRRLTIELERGQEETVLTYIRGGEGLALANTIALAFQDFDRRLQKGQREWEQDSAKRIGWMRWSLPLTALGGVVCGIGIGRTTDRRRNNVPPQLTPCV
jgi:CHASE3 domain sensor protein